MSSMLPKIRKRIRRGSEELETGRHFVPMGMDVRVQWRLKQGSVGVVVVSMWGLA